MLLAACTKPSPAPAPAPEQYDRYIFFSHSVETKAELVEDAAGLNEKSFGVVGFKYDFDKTWETEKATATPNVFADTPETVDVSAQGTTAEYAPLQGWSNNKKYTFFAFYPHMPLVNLDGSTPYNGGVPAIKYTMSLNSEDPTDGATLKASMDDVMTAPAHVDKFWKSSAQNENNVPKGEINFDFSHRLACLGLKITNQSSGDIKIDGVTVTVSGIKYQELIIPLDNTSTVTAPNNPTGITLNSVSFNLDPTLNLQEGQTELLISSYASKELDDKLIFIPQEEDLSIELTIKYTRKKVNSYTGYNDEFTTQVLTTKLIQGQKHLIKLKFTDSTVEVNGKVSEEGWVEIPDVNSSFK